MTAAALSLASLSTAAASASASSCAGLALALARSAGFWAALLRSASLIAFETGWAPFADSWPCCWGRVFELAAAGRAKVEPGGCFPVSLGGFEVAAAAAMEEELSLIRGMTEGLWEEVEVEVGMLSLSLWRLENEEAMYLGVRMSDGGGGGGGCIPSIVRLWRRRSAVGTGGGALGATTQRASGDDVLRGSRRKLWLRG